MAPSPLLPFHHVERRNVLRLLAFLPQRRRRKDGQAPNYGTVQSNPYVLATPVSNDCMYSQLAGDQLHSQARFVEAHSVVWSHLWNHAICFPNVLRHRSLLVSGFDK